MTELFHGEIRVAARIVDYLSSGLYPSTAACLKELINNSYDADAQRVDVFVKPDADQIVIVDDGVGFNRANFERHFRSLAESHKRDDSDRTKRGRPKIGKIGIGFIAANELCEEMEIFSTTKGSNELLHVVIDFSEMRKPIEERRREDNTIVKADYTGDITEVSEESHFTQLFLKKVRGAARDMLVSSKRAQLKGNALTLYGLNPESVAKLLGASTLKSWDQFDYYSQNLLEVGLNVPVRYLDDWMPRYGRAKVKQFSEAAEKLNFTVHYDGAEIRKPILFRDDKPFLIHKFKFDGKEVSAVGYFFARHGTIEPHQLQGLLCRIRNSAVGEYDTSFWDFSQTEFPLIQRWVSCEIWASDELEEAMNIDRATLRQTHPAYVELKEAIHKQLRVVLARAREELYQKASDERNVVRREQAAHDLRQLADSVVHDVSPQAAIELKSYLQKNTPNRIDPLKKLTISELYEIIADIAQEVLPKPLFVKFLRALNKRLGKED